MQYGLHKVVKLPERQAESLRASQSVQGIALHSHDYIPLTCNMPQSKRLQGTSCPLLRWRSSLNVHRPTWAACSENRVSKLSESGSTRSFNHTWKLSISTFATTITCLRRKLSCSPGCPQPLIPRRLHPWALVCRTALQGNVTEAYHHGPTNRSKDRDG